MSLTILLIEDSLLLRELLAELVEGAFPNVCIERAASAEEGLRMLGNGHAVDLVLMDIGLPGMNGLDATREVKRIAPDTQVIMLTQYDCKEYRRAAEQAGAAAYVGKRDAARVLVPTIESVCRATGRQL